MSPQPSPIQVLFLWSLLARGGEAWLSDLKPRLEPASRRKQLAQAGLTEEESRRHPTSGRPQKLIRLTDAGWAWAQANLDAEVSTRSTAGAAILRSFLSRLKPYLERNEIPLVEVLCPEVATPQLADRIRNAYLEHAGGRWNTRVRLHRLRSNLADVPRETLDRALLELERSGRLVLYPLEDPREIETRDEQAAIEIGGAPSHVVYMEG